MDERKIFQFPAGGREGKNIQDAIDVLKGDIEKVRAEIREAEIALNKLREIMQGEKDVIGESESVATELFKRQDFIAKEHLDILKKELEQKEQELRELLGK